MGTKYTFKFSQILPLVFALFIDNLSFGSVYPLVTAIFRSEPTLFFKPYTSVEILDAYMSLAYLLFPLGMFFGASLLGDVSDHCGRKKTLIICMLGIALGFLLMMLGTLIGWIALFLIGRLLTGLMAGAQPIAQASIVDISDAKSKALNMSFVTFAVIMGVAFGPMIGGLFADRNLFSVFGYYLPLVVFAIMAVIAALWIAFAFQETTQKVENKTAIHWLRPFKNFTEGLRHRWIGALIWIFFIFQVGFSVYFQFMLVKLQKEFEFTVFTMGLFTGFLGINFMLALLVIMKRVVHLIRIEYLSLVTMLGTGLAILISAYLSSLIAIWILAIFVGMLDIIAYTAALTSFSNATDASRQGWALGIATASMALAWLISALFANLLPFIGIDHVIGIGGILVILASGLFALYCRKKALTWKDVHHEKD